MVFILEILGDILVPCLFQLLEAACIPWLVCHPSAIASRCPLFLLSHLSLPLTLLPQFPLQRHWAHPDNPEESPCVKSVTSSHLQNPFTV